MSLHVNVPKGTVTEKDVSCDSSFMKEVMAKVGIKIREYYSFVPHDVPIYLFMDNAGGHGKKQSKRSMQNI